MQHYRAYRAALEQGNLQVAEAEAASALAASIEQYGDGGRTAALAVNLAGIRLALNENAAAIEPARRALAIAESQGVASGVDVRVVRLILGRAELPEGGAAALERLLLAVREAQGVPEIDGEAYPAAVELAAAAFKAGQYRMSGEAWAASAQFAEGSRVNPDYARARAELGEAMAAFRQHAMDPSAPRLGSRLPPAPDFAQIDAMLTEAMDTIHDQAMQGKAGGELTLAQALFGEAYAWKMALDAKLTSEGRPLKSKAHPQKQDYEVGATSDPRPVCKARLIAEPSPVFPPAAQVEGGIGAVVIKVLVDESGKITRVQVAGSVGGQPFTDSVVAVADKWRYEKTDPAIAGCRMSREIFNSIRFIYR